MRLTRTDNWDGEKVNLFQLLPRHVGSQYVNWLNDPVVTKYLESRFSINDQSSARKFVRYHLESSNSVLFGIRSKTLDRHVGNIKLGPIDSHHGLGEIGLMIGDRDAWGFGIGSDAICCISRVASADLGLRKLTAGCYASNTASKKAFLKAGFHEEGRRASHFVMEQRLEDLILVAKFLQR